MKVTPIIANRFKSDGGTMFGLVPKGIWSRLAAPDDANLIKQDAHVLLVELDDGRLGLVDTGCGPESRFTEKAARLHHLSAGWPLEERLTALGIGPGSIDFVVFTHLHWDHAGGAARGDTETVEPSFPNAVHFIHEKEWADATSGDPLLYKSYPAETVDPLKILPEKQRVLVKKDREEVLPGLFMVRSGGHTRGHCVVEIRHDTGIEIQHPEAMFMFTPRRIVFAGDVCPMHHNLRMVFQTSYDTYPLETRKWKTGALERMASEQALLMFDHDPELFGCTIRPDPRREYAVDKTLHTAFSPCHALSIEKLSAKGAKEDNPPKEV